MSNTLYRNRFLISRRLVQVSLLILFAGSHYWGWKTLMGNYSSAWVLKEFYLIDPFAVLQILFAGFVVAADALIGALIVFVFYALIGGRMFCSWVCPVNIISDLAIFIRKKLKIGDFLINYSIDRSSRYWTFGLSLVLSFIMGVAAFEFISPISVIYRGVIFGFGMGWLFIVMILLFDLIITRNGWCGHLCPLGGFYSLINKISILKVNHIKDNCTDCNKCFVVCPEKQVLSIIGKSDGYITKGECTNCARCIEVCEDNALHFKAANLLRK